MKHIRHTRYIKKHLSSSQIIILGFAGVILLGSLLLMLPISTQDGNRERYRNLLEHIRADHHPFSHPDRRHGRYYRGSRNFRHIWKANQPKTAQYDAGGNFCT